MRAAEAAWIGDVLKSEPAESLDPIVDIGGSTTAFLDDRPHIRDNIYAPLSERSIRVFNVDLKDDPGVHIVGDIFDPEVQGRIAALQPGAVMCCNIFEHVEHPERFAQVIESIVAPGGLVIVSVPRSYPYHLDPIDTYYRPTPEELSGLFPGLSIVASEVVVDKTYRDDLRAKGKKAVLEVPLMIVKSLLLRGGVEESKARLHRLLWLTRKYEVTVLALRKNAGAA